MSAAGCAEVAALTEKARRIRLGVVRMAAMSDCHTGGSLSIAEILSVLYFHTMRVDPAYPEWLDRDYLVLCKGHCVPALDAALALRGFFDEALLETHLEPDSFVTGHACARLTPGIDVSTGTLGHGLPIAVGLALGVRMDGGDNRVFAILGDGELQEGSNWEAAMAAAHHGLERLVAIVDRNHYQTGETEKMMALEPLAEKWRSFGWGVREVDGHSVAALVEAMDGLPFMAGKPSVVIADTEKGHGVSFLSTLHMARLTQEQYEQAVAELTGGGVDG